ncbi:MAG TPA: molecular chaperone DnaJ [Fimbriimonadales bacterium]|nr:molecular chaperone DnaJ [Fimbriimonadales bacterium]
MPEKDYYALLGVPRDASPDEIKAAFRRLARKYHPDVNRDDPNAEEKFKQIGEAYAVLSDPSKRTQYDRYGVVSDGMAGGFDFTGSISEIFEMFFGATAGARKGTRARDGRDLQVDVLVTLKEVVTGTSKILDLQRMETCTECNGTGAAKGAQPIACRDCGGTGVVMHITNTLMGQIRRAMTCPHCSGQGEIIEEKCKRCKGKMLEKRHARVEVEIPPGVDNGTLLHLPYQGDDGLYGGRPGDLYVAVRVKDDPRFIRDERGLLTYVEVTFPQAALGTTLKIDGIDEELELKIPPGTQPSQEFRLQGKGLPKIGSKERGDLRVRVIVNVPKKLTEEQKRLLEEFQKSLEGQAREESSSFLHTLKESFKKRG